MTRMTQDPRPMAITSFHLTHGTDMVVNLLDNPLGPESKKKCRSKFDKIKPLAMIIWTN